MKSDSKTKNLIAELAKWSRKNSIVQIWWRDDDANRPTSNLDWMLKTIDSLEFKPLLAAIPNLSSRELAKALETNGLPIAVHGLSHSNYEPADSRKSEFGPSRTLRNIKKDLIQAKEQLSNIFGDSVIDCFVPPWNRIREDIIPNLSELGFSGFSSFGKRSSKVHESNLKWFNTHVDVIDWRNTRHFIGREAMISQITDNLRRQRTRSGTSEPVGVLTHHLNMIESDWEEFRNIFTVLKKNNAVRFVDPLELFH